MNDDLLLLRLAPLHTTHACHAKTLNNRFELIPLALPVHGDVEQAIKQAHTCNRQPLIHIREPLLAFILKRSNSHLGFFTFQDFIHKREGSGGESCNLRWREPMQEMSDYLTLISLIQNLPRRIFYCLVRGFLL